MKLRLQFELGCKSATGLRWPASRTDGVLRTWASDRPAGNRAYWTLRSHSLTATEVWHEGWLSDVRGCRSSTPRGRLCDRPRRACAVAYRLVKARHDRGGVRA